MAQITLKQTPEFAAWRTELRDARAKGAVAARLNRLAYGLAGDTKSVGDGVSELRIHYGPGYRIYYTRQGNTVILLLCGGDKSSQSRDIAQAKTLAQLWSEK